MLRVNEYRFAWVEADGVNWWVPFTFTVEQHLKAFLPDIFKEINTFNHPTEVFYIFHVCLTMDYANLLISQ